MQKHLNQSHECDKHNIYEMKKAKVPKRKVDALEKRWAKETIKFAKFCNRNWDYCKLYW